MYDEFEVRKHGTARRLLVGILLPGLMAGCGLVEPDPAEEVVVQPLQTTYLTEPMPIDLGMHPLEAPPGEVLIDSLLYRADTFVADTAIGAGPMSLGLRVRVRNPFDHPVTVRVQECPEWPRAYETVDRSDPPVWAPARGSLGFFCPQGESDVTVAPQEEVTGGISILPYDLSMNLPDGRYYFTMEFWTPDEILMLPAGSADVRYREPGLDFDVRIEDTPDGPRAEVGVTNRNDVPMKLEWGHCALTAALYRNEERTALVREWPAQTTCIDFLRLATVMPGERIQGAEFTRTFDPARILDLPVGEYFLSVRAQFNLHVYDIPAGVIELR